jgi:hypothetical protein
MDEVKSALKCQQQDSSGSRTTTLTFASKPPFKKDDFPAIKFWRQRDYTQYLNSKKRSRGIVDPTIAPYRRGGTRLAASNENVATDYIELEDGQVVEGDKAANIRKRVRDIFKEMNSSTKMVLPKTWSEAGITERNFFLQELYKDYPYIAFCDDDWKAIFLASRTLSAFHNSLRRKIKSEVVEKNLKEELPTELHTITVADSNPIPIPISHSPVKRTAPEASHGDSEEPLEPPSKRCRIQVASPIQAIPTPIIDSDSTTTTTDKSTRDSTVTTAASQSDMDSVGLRSTSIPPPASDNSDIQLSSGPVTVPQLHKTQRTQAEEKEPVPQVAIGTAVRLVNPL